MIPIRLVLGIAVNRSMFFTQDLEAPPVMRCKNWHQASEGSKYCSECGGPISPWREETLTPLGVQWVEYFQLKGPRDWCEMLRASTMLHASDVDFLHAVAGTEVALQDDGTFCSAPRLRYVGEEELRGGSALRQTAQMLYGTGLRAVGEIRLYVMGPERDVG
jgi:hypothetical protein